MTERIIKTVSSQSTAAIFGAFDQNVRLIENAFEVKISNTQVDSGETDAISVKGEKENVDMAVIALEHLKRVSEVGEVIDEQSVEYAISAVRDKIVESPECLGRDVICVTGRGKPIKAKTIGQKKYVETIKNNTIIFGLGPAGTGKTFLAVAMATEALRAKNVNRIILTRPAVEAGEHLGFLPGDLQSKVDPYLRPLYDALFEMLGAENCQKFLERNIIEIAPLAYMRGRTLDDSFIILDEAQNTTPEQMKMFLTRLGYNSKVVVTGDLSQTDLAPGKKSGLSIAAGILTNIDGIGIFEFSERDVVRHHLVRKIISAYDKYDRENASSKMKIGAKKNYRTEGKNNDRH